MIKEYDLEVFRRKFWIAINSPLKEMAENLLYRSNDNNYIELTERDYEDQKECDGCLYKVITKKERQKGFLLYLKDNPKDIVDLVNLISHESGHLAYSLFKDIQEEEVGTEANSHVIGYVAGKCMEAILEYRKNKKKK